MAEGAAVPVVPDRPHPQQCGAGNPAPPKQLQFLDLMTSVDDPRHIFSLDFPLWFQLSQIVCTKMIFWAVIGDCFHLICYTCAAITSKGRERMHASYVTVSL
jgi:hypothetical protein